MPKSGRPSSTAGRTINQRNPLGKNLACVSCKTRRVRCDGVAPSCGACLRSARHEGRDPASCGCTYASSKLAKVDERRTREVKSEAGDTPSDEEDDLNLTFREDMDAYLNSWTNDESTQFPFPLPSDRRFSTSSLSSTSSGSSTTPFTSPDPSPSFNFVPLPVPCLPLPPLPSPSIFTPAPSSTRLRFTPLQPPPPLPNLPFLLHSCSSPTSITLPSQPPPSTSPATLFSNFVFENTLARGITIPEQAISTKEAEDWLASCIDIESSLDPTFSPIPVAHLPLWDTDQLVFPSVFEDGERRGDFGGGGWRDEMTALDELELMLCKGVQESGRMSWVGGLED